MHSRALETRADATIPELIFYHEKQKGGRKLSGLNGNKDIVLSGKDAFLYSLDWIIPGNALWKTNILKQTMYLDFSYNADEYTVRAMFLKCNKVVFSDGIFYYYQDNPEAITKKVTAKWLDVPYTELKLYKLAKENGFSPEVQEKLLFRSIFGLLNLNPLKYRKSIDNGVTKVYRCRQSWLQEDVLSFLAGRPRSIRREVAMTVVRSYFAFEIISAAMLLRAKLEAIVRRR